MRYCTAGESHGKALICIIEDVPAGLVLSQEDFDRELARRQLGYGRGARQRIECDQTQVLAGIRYGKTLGSPIALLIPNMDSANWQEKLSAFGVDGGSDYLHTPRPNHADLAGCLKNDMDDCRNVLERASARETAARVAAGAVAKAFLAQLGVVIYSQVLSIGGVAGDDSFDAVRQRIDRAAAEGESLGGIFQLKVTGLMPGLGGYEQRSQALDARIAAAIMSIPAIKGVEFGDGFQLAAMSGSQAADAITAQGRTGNHMGGVEGGMSTGEDLLVKAVVKPIPTFAKPVSTIDMVTGEPAFAFKERADVCAVPAAAVVAEAELALVLADVCQRSFGYGCMTDVLANAATYRQRIRDRWRRD